jgi:UDP-2-acetamido-2,6-beta-L-arabino-hexul-4-ose reductase
LTSQIINEKEYAFTYPVDHTNTITVSEIANLLVNYKNNYTDNAIIPQLNSRFEINLFNTFRSYLDIKKIRKT